MYLTIKGSCKLDWLPEKKCSFEPGPVYDNIENLHMTIHGLYNRFGVLWQNSQTYSIDGIPSKKMNHFHWHNKCTQDTGWSFESMF